MNYIYKQIINKIILFILIFICIFLIINLFIFIFSIIKGLSFNKGMELICKEFGELVERSNQPTNQGYLL